MKKVNFKKFGVYTDIGKYSVSEVDVRKEFSDILYTRISGIMAHDLAFRIYRSEGDIELNEEESSLLLSVARQCSGAFYDSLNEKLGAQ